VQAILVTSQNLLLGDKATTLQDFFFFGSVSNAQVGVASPGRAHTRFSSRFFTSLNKSVAQPCFYMFLHNGSSTCDKKNPVHHMDKLKKSVVGYPVPAQLSLAEHSCNAFCFSFPSLPPSHVHTTYNCASPHMNASLLLRVSSPFTSLHTPTNPTPLLTPDPSKPIPLAVLSLFTYTSHRETRLR
jgi:hypothetical protein